MAKQKKGCGFLIIALVLLLLGGGIATYLGMSAVATGKEFTENIQKGKVFVTPLPGIYSAEEDSEVTVWLTSNDAAPDLDSIEIEVTEKGSGTTTTATKATSTNSMGNQYHVATFKVEKGKDYMVNAKGVAAGETFRIASISSNAVLSMLGKGFGAFGVIGVFGFLALIFGIIGMVKFFGGKKEQPAVAAAPGPPAV